MRLDIELDQETDGRWIADVPGIPGVMVYADSPDEALVKVKVLALRVLADQIEHGEIASDSLSDLFQTA